MEEETQPEDVQCYDAKVEKSTFTDDIPDLAIDYVVNGQYSEELTADQRRSVRRRAKSIFIEGGEVFINKKGKKVHDCLAISVAVAELVLLSFY